MSKQRKRHARSDESRVRRITKTRARAALKAASALPNEIASETSQSPEFPKAPASGIPTESLADSVSKVDGEAAKLYKKAVEEASDEYQSRRARITDGTAMASSVEWGPVAGCSDPNEEMDRDQKGIAAIRNCLDIAVSELSDGVCGSVLSEWTKLNRQEQGERQDIWRTVGPEIERRAKLLRAELYAATKVDESSENNEISLRAALLEGLLKSTGSLSDPDDVEVLRQITQEGGVGIGIDNPIKATGKWPSKAAEARAEPARFNHGAGGLSIFALDSWRNYQSAASLEDGVREYLQHEVQVGNMRELEVFPEGGIVSKIAAIEKRPGELNSPIRIIDDLRRSGVNSKIRATETLQLPGLATTALIIHGHKKFLHEKGKIRGPNEGDDGQVMIEIDCAAAYRNIPILQEEQRYCMNFIPSKTGKGTLICHTKLPFGLSSSGLQWVRVYAGLVQVVKRLLAYPHGEGAQVYIDDLVYITTRRAALHRLLAILLLHAAVGINISYNKVRVSSTPVVLGYEWNTELGTVAVPTDRQIRLVEQIEPLREAYREGKPISVRELESVVGRSAWAAQIICQFRAKLKPLYGRIGIARRKNLWAINMTAQVMESLDFLQQILEGPTRVTSNATSLLGAGCLGEEGQMPGVVISDSSIKAFSAVILLPWASFWFVVDGEELETRRIVNTWLEKPEGTRWQAGDISSLELIGALTGSMLLPRDRPGLILCDNIAAVEAINRAAGKAERMNHIISVTSRHLAFGRGLRASHIPTHENWLVDGLSRTTNQKAARQLMEGSSIQEVDGLYLLKSLFGDGS